MTISHISWNQFTKYGGMLRTDLTNLELGYVKLQDTMQTMATMIDGDQGDAANYDEVKTQFGFEDNETAKEAFLQVNTLISKLTTNDAVTAVKDALEQTFDKMR